RMDQPLEGGLWAEVEQKSDFEIRATEVIEQLPSMSFGENARRLHFDDDLRRDDKIGAEYADALAIVPDVDRLLALELDAGGSELDEQSVDVDGLGISKSKTIVNAIEPPNHVAGDSSLGQPLKRACL